MMNAVKAGEAGKLAVYWGEGTWSAASVFDDGHSWRQWHGYLTTDHAASCYGLPVLVREDGVVLGPADLPAGTVLQSNYGQFHLTNDLTEEDAGFLDRLFALGSASHDAARYREIAGLIRGALAAGYRLDGFDTAE